VIVLSPGTKDAHPLVLGQLAAEVTGCAIARGVVLASAHDGVPCHADLRPAPLSAVRS
jgi:hypothetical protein